MTRLEIVVDYDLCEANAVCVGIAPDVFRIDDAERLELLVESPASDRVDDVREAVRLCPRGALKLVEG